jgi:hypothetical protein
VDRLIDWIERWPGPAWLFYAGLAVALVGLETAVKFADGTYPARFHPWHLVLALTGIYYQALIHWLDRMAARILAAFRPIMTVDDAAYTRLAYELTTLPARPTLGFTALWAAWGALQLTAVPTTLLQALAMYTSPLAVAVELALWVFAWWGGGALIYHTVHQLSLVSRILTAHVRIDLFALQPLYAFSRLTAVTALGLILVPYAWFSAVPDMLTSSTTPLAVIMVLINAALVASTFGWPLWGVHRLLVAEKRSWQAALRARMRATILDLEQCIDSGDRAASTQFKDILDGLVAAEAALDKIPTWPWNPSTIRGLAGAVLLPLVLWLITRVLERLIVF